MQWKTHFFTGALCFLCQVSLKTTHPTHADKVKAVLINQGQYEQQKEQWQHSPVWRASCSLNLQHHMLSRGQCYTLATVPLGKLTTASRVGPRVSLHTVVKRKFPPPPEMNCKCLVIQHIC